MGVIPSAVSGVVGLASKPIKGLLGLFPFGK